MVVWQSGMLRLVNQVISFEARQCDDNFTPN